MKIRMETKMKIEIKIIIKMKIMIKIRTPQLVCILRKLKTKPNGCLGRSAS